MKRLGRYLKGKPRLVTKYEWQVPVYLIIITANSDTDWAGDKKTYESTSEGIVCIGSHYIKSWSKNQSVIALSSAASAEECLHTEGTGPGPPLCASILLLKLRQQKHKQTHMKYLPIKNARIDPSTYVVETDERVGKKH